MESGLSTSFHYVPVKDSLVRLIIITVGVSLTAASIYTAISVSGEPAVYSYIPGNSEFISHFTYGNGSYYMFATNTSYGIITETPVWQVEQAVSHAVNTNGTSTNVTISTALSYKGYTVFKISGIGLPEIMKLLGEPSSGSNVTIPVGTLDVYTSELSQSYTVVGSMGGVMSSINASIHNTGFRNFGKLVNENVPFSAAVLSVPGGTISHISVNITNQSTSVTLKWSGPVQFPTGLDLNNSMLRVQSISGHSVTLVAGFGWSEVQAALFNILSLLSNNGGFNVKDITGLSLLF